MKKLIFIAAVLLVTVVVASCKKEDNSPVKSVTATPPPAPIDSTAANGAHFFYHWNYDAPAGVVHSDSACITDDSIRVLRVTIGAYNVNKGVGC